MELVFCVLCHGLRCNLLLLYKVCALVMTPNLHYFLLCIFLFLFQFHYCLRLVICVYYFTPIYIYIYTYKFLGVYPKRYLFGDT